MAGDFRPDDWKRVRNPRGEPGLKDFYANLDTGKVMTRRQYLNRVRGKSVEQYTKESKSAIRKAGIYQQHNGYTDAIYEDYERAYRRRNPGKKIPKFRSDEFQQILDDLSSNSKSGKGRKARALKKIGRKRSNDYSDVGETPR